MKVVLVEWPIVRLDQRDCRIRLVAPLFRKLVLKPRSVFVSLAGVSPTIFRYRNYRFYFFSREEPRMHVHVISPDGEAKFWLEPQITLAVNKGLGATELNELLRIVEERQDEIREHWRRHFQR